MATRMRVPILPPALGLILGCLVGPEAGAARAAARPNVLVIISDDLRSQLGCYGDTVVKPKTLPANRPMPAGSRRSPPSSPPAGAERFLDL